MGRLRPPGDGGVADGAVSDVDPFGLTLVSPRTANALGAALPIAPARTSTSRLGAGGSQLGAAPSQQQQGTGGGQPPAPPIADLPLSVPATSFLTQSLGQAAVLLPPSNAQATRSYSRAAGLSHWQAGSLGGGLPSPTGNGVNLLT